MKEYAIRYVRKDPSSLYSSMVWTFAIFREGSIDYFMDRALSSPANLDNYIYWLEERDITDWRTSDTELHTYTIDVGPKMLRESLCVAQSALNHYNEEYPSRGRSSSDAITKLIKECERKRPTKSNGRHGNLHTEECGCLDK